MTYLEQRRQFIQAGRPLKQKERYTIPKVSAKRAAKIKEQKEIGGDGEIDLFFVSMRKRCKCKCLFCGKPTTSKNDELWRIAIAHLLPKSKFISVATNENNWVELCWDCHTDFDNAKISWEFIHDSAEWLAIKEKLFEVLPLVAETERSNKLYAKLLDLIYG